MTSARNIQNGVEQLAESMSRTMADDQARQWREIRGKIDSILLSTTTLKTDEVRRNCQELDSMSSADRSTYISQRWGPAFLNKVEPLLQQLAVIEDKMAN
jgi:hypothetical protein